MPDTERHSVILGLGSQLAVLCLVLAILPWEPWAPASAALPLYPPLAALFGLCGVVLGSTHWGRFLLFGLVTMALAPVMGAWPACGPALFAVMPACWLVWWGIALKRSFLGPRPG